MNESAREHDRAVAGLFGRIARFYDLLNHVLSVGVDLYWRRQLARAARVGDTHRILDLAAGTLDASLALRRRHPTCRVIAADFCRPMLVLGKEKLARRHARNILLVTGDGKRLPLPDRCVDSVTIAFGIRNILPRAEALAEMRRVLVPGGRVCILEFGSGRERIWGGLYNFYLNRILPIVGRLVSRDRAAYSYLARTIREFPSAWQLAQEMRDAGFVRVRYTKLTSGIVCLHVGERGQDAPGRHG